MGSFNVACSISGLSIDCGDPIVFIPLIDSKYKEYGIGDHNHFLIMSECFYEPLTLPIFGEYDDYGRIDYQEDKNTEFLKSLGMNINELIEPMEHDESPATSGMFVHKHIYNVVRDKSSELDDCGKKQHTMRRLRSEYDEFAKDVRKAQEELEKINNQDVSDHVPGFTIRTLLINADWKTFNFRRWHHFRKTYDHKVIAQGDLRDELIDFTAFTVGMYASNRFFFPAMNGYQFGNPWATRPLNNEALRISREKIKKYNENMRR